MLRLRLALIFGIVFLLLLLSLSLGVWEYLFGPNKVDSAELVPGNTIVFASIPNAATLLEGYQTSQAKTLIESPNIKPLHDAIVNLVGQKNVDLFHCFLPNLSGQSFIAVTHFDYDHPEQIGLIAAMKPKAGLGDFGTFLEKLKTAWPDIIKQGKTGMGTIAGVDYEWIQGPGASDKICVAQIDGWIVTSWGEASLQDWVERFRKQSSTSSLAQDLNYRKAMARVGDDPMTLVYINNHALVGFLQKQVTKTSPAAGDYLAQKLDALGGAAVAARFENGEIVDRISFLLPRPAQLDFGMSSNPCPFDTLKFTGPDTRFYWASSINWKQYYKCLKEQSGQPGTVNPMENELITFLQTWARGTTLDIQHDIVEPLGSEFSVQMEWNQDAPYPEVGLFVKLDKPDDFKPAIAAIIESVRKAYASTAVIKEINSNGQNFAALKFVQPSPISPTITEDGPYLGIFLTENQAVRSFQRDQTIGLAHRAEFNRQVGDKRQGASQIIFLDSPQLLDHAYRTAMPYLSLVGMFNKDVAAMLKGKDLPADLTWLAPIGTWSCVMTPDEEGIQGYSVSGIGNQGIFLASVAGEAMNVMQAMGLFPKPASAPGTTYVSGMPPSAQPNSAGTPNAILSPASLKSDGTPAPDTINKNSDATIYISSDSKIFFDSALISPDQIGDFLKSKKAANPALKLTVKVDRDASPDVLSTVMDAGASAGFGVLPYAYSSNPHPPLPLPPATNSDSSAVPSLLNTVTNAAPASSNAVTTPSIPNPATNAPSSTPEPVKTP